MAALKIKIKERNVKDKNKRDEYRRTIYPVMQGELADEFFLGLFLGR